MPVSEPDSCSACGFTPGDGPLDDDFSRSIDRIDGLVATTRVERIQCPLCGTLVDEHQHLAAADGGQGAPMPRPESDDNDVSPAAVEVLESRVDRLEREIDEMEETLKDAMAMLNELREGKDE